MKINGDGFWVTFMFSVICVDVFVASETSATQWSTECITVCKCVSQLHPVTGSYRKIVDCSEDRIQRDTHPALPLDTASLNLSSNDLTLSHILPAVHSLQELKCLNLSHNDIWKVREMKSLTSHLSILDISSNSVSGLPGDWILYRDQLTFLNLSCNKLEFIHHTAFSNMNKLNYLDLSHNGIWQLHKKWFHDLAELETLVLSDNMVTSLSEKLFEHLVSLVSLDLSNNRIDAIDLGAFHGLTKLKHLSLNGNKIRGNLTRKIEGFDRLSVLDLSNNDFKRIATHSFINVKTERIILNKCKYLKYVQWEAFINMPFVVSLELSGNPQLEYIDSKAFSNLPLLERLSLNDNQLRAVFNQTIASLPSLQNLFIKGNPMICDCNVHWLIAKHNLHIVDLNDTVCHGPTLLSGRILSQSLRWYVPSLCLPKIVPSIAPTYSRLFGQPFHMECYALGNPPPDVYWIFTKNTTDQFCSLNITEILQPFRSGGSLSIRQLTFQNSGHYKCVAQNSPGRSVKCFHVDVEGNKGNVVILQSTDNSIVFTWNGTDPDNKHKILYRKIVNISRNDFRVVEISPRMRKYSLGHLNSSSLFEICIALQSDMSSLDRKCVTVSTNDRQTRLEGIYSARHLFIALSVGGFVLFLLCASVVFIVIKKYNKSHDIGRYMLPQSTSCQRIVSSSEGRSSVGTPTTYKNKMLELSDEEVFIEESEASFPPLVT